MRLLHVDSSAHRAAESVSRQLTSLFARVWCAHDEAEHRYRDLAATPVAPLGTAYCALGRRVERYGMGRVVGRIEDLIEDDDEQHEWDLTRELVDELLASDVLLVGAPMYNYSAPAALKAWIDRVGFPGVFTGADGSALLAGLHVVVVISCGGAYGPGTGASDRDFLRPHLRAWFAKQGVAPSQVEIVTADRTLAPIVPGREDLRPAAAQSLAAARDELTAIARSSWERPASDRGARGHREPATASRAWRCRRWAAIRTGASVHP